MAPNDDTVATLSDSLRRVSEQLMAAKQGRTACANLVTEGSALLMEMRRQEEHIWGQVAQPVMEAAAAKRSMEDAEAELHGLRYHKQQCVRGLAECNELAPQLPSDLITERELKQLAPELPTAESAHQLQLQRLAVECHERNQLRQNLEEANAQKAEHAQLARKRKDLHSLVANQLDGIISAASNLQARLPPLPSLQSHAHSDPLAPLLPAPLYTLWHGAAAYAAAWSAPGNMVVVGDEVTARRLQQSELQSDSPPVSTAGSEGAQEVFAAHPLRVTVQLDSGKVEVAFSYHPQLQMIGVSAKPMEAAAKLAALFPADDGCSFPDERCALRALSRFGAGACSLTLPELSPMLPAKPFKWAQWLAGLGPLVASDAPAPPSFQRAMDALFSLRK